jgi:hypothetical protein
MMPSFLACVAVTAGIVALGYAPFARRVGPSLIYLMIGTVWLFQLVRWGYRVGGYNYRLTSRRLFVGRGLLYPRADGLELARIARVGVRRTLSDRIVKAGSVVLELEDGSAHALPGLAGPEGFAATLEAAARAARERTAVAVSLPVADPNRRARAPVPVPPG